MCMYMQVRSQRDRLCLELEESKKYIEVLKENFDKENKREAIEDEFINTDGIKRLNKTVKEIEKIWNDTKLSMEKLFLIAEVGLLSGMWFYLMCVTVLHN